MSTDPIYGGVEGGASHTKMSLFDSDMRVLSTVEGPGTNIFQIGHDGTTKIIAGMVAEALGKAGRHPNTKLCSLGMSLSGAERPESNCELVVAFEKAFPDMSASYTVVSDTVGPIATASPDGGIVLIAGTGSNALLINRDGSTGGRCGGWGHLVGDEGSAVWVALKAVKIYFDHLDNKAMAPFEITVVEAAIKEHFGIEDRFDLLVHLYSQWDKSFFSLLCKRLADGAAKGDRLCAYLFEEAGREMALHLLAMVPDMSTDLLECKGGLPIVCVGSVWKSWRFMEPGFMQEVAKDAPRLKELKLLTLKAPVTIGACYVGTDQAKLVVRKEYDQNTVCFHHAKL